MRAGVGCGRWARRQRRRALAKACAEGWRAAGSGWSARAQIWAADAPVVELVEAFEAGAALDGLLGVPVVAQPGLDNEGGVVHEHIGWLVNGTLPSPWFASQQVGVHGRFLYDAEGRLLTTITERVPFTLTIPAANSGPVPLVIFCHGIGSERSTMLSVAAALAESGYATLGIDLPFHGLRASDEILDVRHNYGETTGPDGFGDRTGNAVTLDFLGAQDTAGPLSPLHPTYVRDALRQSTVDLMSAVRVAREGDWSAVQAIAGLSSFAIAAEPIAFVGVFLGGIIGTVFTVAEPEIGAAVLNVTGGDLSRLVERSAGFGPVLLPIVYPKLGVTAETIDYESYPPSAFPELAIFQTLLDRGDSMSFAPLLRRAPRHVLFQMAVDDETVPNSATEALARAAGATILDAEPRFTDLPQGSTPVSDNLDVSDALYTRGLTTFAPATHGLITNRAGAQRVVAPPEPPFPATTPVDVANPVEGALSQLVHFLDSWRGGTAEVIAP